jgi:hypothetical protein
MSDIPDSIVLKRDRDLEGRRHEIWFRRGILALIGAFIVAALLNVFGQRPSTATATSPAASLQLYAPSALRGGLLWSARFTVTAYRALKKAILVLSPSWAESMSVNTIEPSPVEETSDNGKLVFTLGPIGAGKTYVLFMQFQVNPTNVGHVARTVELFDGKTRLASVNQTMTVYP